MTFRVRRGGGERSTRGLVDHEGTGFTGWRRTGTANTWHPPPWSSGGSATVSAEVSWRLMPGVPAAAQAAGIASKAVEDAPVRDKAAGAASPSSSAPTTKLSITPASTASVATGAIALLPTDTPARPHHLHLQWGRRGGAIGSCRRRRSVS